MMGFSTEFMPDLGIKLVLLSAILLTRISHIDKISVSELFCHQPD